MSLIEEQAKTATPIRREKKRGKNFEMGSIIPEETKIIVKTSQIAAKIRSVDHFVYLYATERKYFLPPKKFITWEYIRQILSGEKVLLKFRRIEQQFQLPRTKGFYVRSVFQQLANDSEFMLYFPDFSKDAHVPRDYFITVVLIGLKSHSSSKVLRIIGPVEQ